jgi:FkbM family methyltransferase
MIELVLKLLKPIYKYFFIKNYRKFQNLLSKKYFYSRYKIVKNIKFNNYNIDVPDYLSFVWQFKDIFVDEIYKINFTKNNPIIFDCGANIGMSLIYFKSLYPKSRIIAFEGDKTILKFLKNNLKNNNINDINLIEKLVWINNNGVNFIPDGADGGAININKNNNIVNSIRLKNLIDLEKSIDLLKIDIEGAEIEVINDCKDSLNKVKNIFIEFHSFKDRNQELGSLLLILEKNNFRYIIQDLGKIKHPFTNRNKKLIDHQLNVFAYKK